MSGANKKRTCNSVEEGAVTEDEDQQFLLRVRRRRAGSTIAGLARPENLRLGLGFDASSALAGMKLHSNSNASGSSSVLFRRVQETATRSSSESGKKRGRIMDAVLLEPGSSNKRQKLTLQLVDSSSSSQKTAAAAAAVPKVKASYPVLTPEQRQVDDSLKLLFQGGISIQEHCQLLKTTVNDNNSNRTGWWPWTWCCPDGNWLHAGAIWNQAETVGTELCRLQQLQSKSTTRTPSLLIAELLQTVDCEGRTPMQVAQMTGHVAVQQVLETYYECNNDVDDDDDYEYDMYCLEKATTKQQEEDKPNDDDDNKSENVLDCELHDQCMGYWNERGQLVLAAGGNLSFDMDENDDDNDDDDDSNDEDCVRNDYPDDDDDDDVWSQSNTVSSSSSEEFDYDAAYRRRPVEADFDDPTGDDQYYERSLWRNLWTKRPRVR